MKRFCFVSINVEHDPNKLDNILNILKKHEIKATLFVTGVVLEKYYDLVQKWDKDFEIGCYNYIHASLEREKQLKRFVRVYQTILGELPKGFRAPQKIIDNKQFQALQRYGFVYDSSIIKGRAPYYLEDMKILEIPITPLFGSIPNFFKFLLKIKKPKFLALIVRSWDGLDEILDILKQADYRFKNGEEIYEAFRQGGK